MTFILRRLIHRSLSLTKLHVAAIRLNHQSVLYSAIQPSGELHLGNYFGAIKQWVSCINSGNYGNVIYSIADLHALTVPKPADVTRDNIFKMAASLIACGVDPSKCILFQQSMVSEHTELSWILGTLCSMSQLESLPTWKEKESNDLGIFIYPILQSADILLYKAMHVPVGDDQVKHIEVTRKLADIFNKKFHPKFFPRPYPLINEKLKRLKSLADPSMKMSKSDPNPLGHIGIFDNPDIIALKIRKSVTDTQKGISYDPIQRPGVSNLLELYSAFSDKSLEEVEKDVLNWNKVQFKSKLTELIIENLRTIQNDYRLLCNNKDFIDQVLHEGAKKAKILSQKTMLDVRKLIGL